MSFCLLDGLHTCSSAQMFAFLLDWPSDRLLADCMRLLDIDIIV
jgi:hypothetical protein